MCSIIFQITSKKFWEHHNQHILEQTQSEMAWNQVVLMVSHQLNSFKYKICKII